MRRNIRNSLSLSLYIMLCILGIVQNSTCPTDYRFFELFQLGSSSYTNAYYNSITTSITNEIFACGYVSGGSPAALLTGVTSTGTVKFIKTFADGSTYCNAI